MKQHMIEIILWALIAIIIGMGVAIYYNGRCDVQLAPEMVHK